MNKTIDETINYFKHKADKYDLVENQEYWSLSDRILWDLMTETLDTLPEDFIFLDAGGGTGRWTIKVLQNYPKSKGLIYDISKDMLDEARAKQTRFNLSNRLEIIQGDLHDLSEISDGTIDIAFNFHNVLGFVEFPNTVLEKITSKLKNNGHLISFIPNKYHAIYFNVSLGQIGRAYESAEGKGRFTEDMPSMHLFTPESITKIYSENNLEKERILGFPIFIYPSYLETQLEGNTERLLDILKTENNFDSIYQLEKRFLKEELAARGNNIYIVGTKK
jgi:ubiquinone/menaquinone biosynthesis C-methylase UbiE